MPNVQAPLTAPGRLRDPSSASARGPIANGAPARAAEIATLEQMALHLSLAHRPSIGGSWGPSAGGGASSTRHYRIRRYDYTAACEVIFLAKGKFAQIHIASSTDPTGVTIDVTSTDAQVLMFGATIAVGNGEAGDLGYESISITASTDDAGSITIYGWFMTPLPVPEVSL